MSRRYQNMAREAIAAFCRARFVRQKVDTMEKVGIYEINRFIYYYK